MATETEVEVDSAKRKPVEGGRVDFTHVVYQALLDIKESQGEVKARLDHIEAKLEKVSSKASATETKLSRIIWVCTGVVGFVVVIATVISKLMR
jgi:tetrahydromethanopterin S-methyltransferase subunit G